MSHDEAAAGSATGATRTILFSSKHMGTIFRA
jgi:hypothetical protein